MNEFRGPDGQILTPDQWREALRAQDGEPIAATTLALPGGGVADICTFWTGLGYPVEDGTPEARGLHAVPDDHPVEPFETHLSYHHCDGGEESLSIQSPTRKAADLAHAWAVEAARARRGARDLPDRRQPGEEQA